MNIPLSLLIYNPIEACTMILLCDVINFKHTKFTLKNIALLYGLSAINFGLQMIPYIWEGSIVHICGNMIVSYGIIPIIVRAFYKIMCGDISYRRVFVAEMIICVYTVVLSMILNVAFGFNNMFINDNILHEFITNSVIFVVQIVSYTFIKKWSIRYEEHFKENRREVR